MGPIGVQEMMLIFLVALVLFGPKKLPELGQLLGKGLTEYRRAKSELKSTFETHLRELEREANVDAALKSVTSPVTYSSPTYNSQIVMMSTDTNRTIPIRRLTRKQLRPPVSSPSSTASATATQDAEANRETPSSPTVSPVAGTVARFNAQSAILEPESPAIMRQRAIPPESVSLRNA